jgi:hypothetical protein
VALQAASKTNETSIGNTLQAKAQLRMDSGRAKQAAIKKDAAVSTLLLLRVYKHQ